MPRTRAPILWYSLFALVFAAQVLPRLAMDSPGGDEMVDIADGYFYWGGDLVSDSRHPPLAKALQALPARFMDLQRAPRASFTNYERRDYHFLFVLNRDKFEKVFLAARSVSLLLGLGTGWLLFLVLRRSPPALLLSCLALWAWEPCLLAFAGYAMADGPESFFYLLAVFLFVRAREGGRGWGRSFAAGMASGAALAVKFSAAVLVPVFLVLEYAASRGKGGKGAAPWAWRWTAGAAGALFFLCLVYLPGTLKLPDHSFPLRYFWDGFTAMAGFSGHPTYFLGELSTRNHGAYYPLAFLLKSPLTFLAFLLLALVLALRGKLSVPLWHWFPGLAFFAAVGPFHNIGLREVLPAYPFFILAASRGAAWLWDRDLGAGRAPKIAVLGLFLAQAASLLAHYPDQLGYFNALVRPGRELYWLGDSNLDMGQDTKRFALFARQKGWGKVKLAYFGTADPELYGMKWDYWTRKDLEGPQPGQVYAVNAAFLQLGPAFLPGARSITGGWISGAAPSGKFGDTWYYFEVPGEPVRDDSPRVPSTMPFKIYGRLND